MRFMTVVMVVVLALFLFGGVNTMVNCKVVIDQVIGSSVHKVNRCHR